MRTRPAKRHLTIVTPRGVRNQLAVASGRAVAHPPVRLTRGEPPPRRELKLDSARLTQPWHPALRLLHPPGKGPQRSRTQALDAANQGCGTGAWHPAGGGCRALAAIHILGLFGGLDGKRRKAG